MIRVDRNGVVAPSSLEEKATRGSRRGKTEGEAILLAFHAYLKAVPRLEHFDYPFNAYKAKDVNKALSQLFHDKCAYCESRYASTQPMDVEHWRPKGGVREPGQTKLADGYPWLAATWTNLLPSCIDCNRSRVQHDALTGKDETLGKENQFPVSGPRMKPPSLDTPAAPVEEIALLVDPTADDPAVHLRFRDDGVAMALTEKGTHSVRVYALNRAELVFERLGLAQLIETRLTTIERLATMISNAQLPELHLRDLRDLAAHEIDALMALAEPGQRYSAMARQLIEENWPLGIAAPPVPQLWPAAVGDMLRRLDATVASPDHVALASRLVGFGFEPHLPVSRAGAGAGGAAYVRWTVTGTQRSVTLYQNRSGLVSDSKPQLAFAKTVPGAEVPHGVRPTVRYTYAHATVTAVLDAVAAFRSWADQP